MKHANLAYFTPANDPAGLPLSLSIYADRAHLRATMRDDAEAAGFRITAAAGLSALLVGEACALGDVVLLDCPALDGAALAALARLDMRAAQSGARLVVSTTIDALEDVFACMDQSNPQLLVDPSRAERVLALGQVLASHSERTVRELSEEDRLMLLRLTEQVAQIAGRLDRLAVPGVGAVMEHNARGVSEGTAGCHGGAEAGGRSGDRLQRAARPPLPDPRLVRRTIRQRQLRARFFDGDLFADPAWDMLLDLTAARAEHQRVSVTSLCIASGVPPTTALRWIGQMIEAGLFQRSEDETDRRRAFITLTDRAADAMARYFVEIGTTPVPVV